MTEKGSRASAGFLHALGAEIRYWRERRGMNRRELADRVGISATTVGRIEREGPSDFPATWRIADALDVKMTVLVDRAEQAAQLDQAREAREASPTTDTEAI